MTSLLASFSALFFIFILTESESLADTLVGETHTQPDTNSDSSRFKSCVSFPSILFSFSLFSHFSLSSDSHGQGVYILIFLFFFLFLFWSGFLGYIYLHFPNRERGEGKNQIIYIYIFIIVCVYIYIDMIDT